MGLVDTFGKMVESTKGCIMKTYDTELALFIGLTDESTKGNGFQGNKKEKD